MACFLCLASNNFTAVDGPLRRLEVFHDRSLKFHGNNHLLYPANIYLWTGLMEQIGVRAESPIECIRLSQALNAAEKAVWALLRSGALSMVCTGS